VLERLPSPEVHIDVVESSFAGTPGLVICMTDVLSLGEGAAVPMDAVEAGGPSAMIKSVLPPGNRVRKSCRT
jgi:hypothetical protein